VTLLVGEASAGKTVLLYNSPTTWRLGRSFWDSRPIARSESCRWTLKAMMNPDHHLGTIGTAPGWDILIPPDDLFALPLNNEDWS